MILKSVISTALFAAIAVLTSSTQAAPNADKAAEAKAPAAEMQSDKAAAQKKDRSWRPTVPKKYNRNSI